MPACRPHFVDQPRIPCHRVWGFPEKYGFFLDRSGFVAAREKKKSVELQVAHPKGIVPPPGILVPDFYLDPRTKIVSCFTREWALLEEDRIIAKLEEQMRSEAKKNKFVGPDFWKQEVLGEFFSGSPSAMGLAAHYARNDAEVTRQVFDRIRSMAKNLPAPAIARAHHIRGPHHSNFFQDEVARMKDQTFITSALSYPELETRILASLSETDREVFGLTDSHFHLIKKRDRATSCRPTTTEPSPQLPIIRPLPPMSTASVEKASVIPRLLAASVSKKPPSISE